MPSFTTALAQHLYCSVQILCNVGGELVGSRKRMKNNVLISNMEQCWWHGYAWSGILWMLWRRSCSQWMILLWCGSPHRLQKTKILATPSITSFSAPPQPVHLNLNEEPMEIVEENQYLGSIISQTVSYTRCHGAGENWSYPLKRACPKCSSSHAVIRLWYLTPIFLSCEESARFYIRCDTCLW